MPSGEDVIRIQPTSGWSALDLGSVWRHRHLIWIFVARDLKARYAQTVLGPMWILAQPLASAIIFAVIFGRLAGLPSDGVPYGVFAYVGLIGWNCFAGAMGRSGNSLLANAGLITKVYFPRLVLPLSGVFGVLIESLIAIALSLPVLGYYGFLPSWRLLIVPLVLLGFSLTAFGTGLVLSALNVRWRDVASAAAFLMQAWMYASPVAYGLSLVPDRWLRLYSLNPVVGWLSLLRWALLETPLPEPSVVIASVTITIASVTIGLFIFRRAERDFADVI